MTALFSSKVLLSAAAVVGIATVALGSALRAQPVANEAPKLLPTPAIDVRASDAGLQTAVLSGGCFWGVQGVYEHVKGVKQVVAGYAGGLKATAAYELVSTGATGHAESVQVRFDPREISYGQILRIFFSVATDPTEVGGQFPDVGSQYRSEIFYASPEQRRVAEAYVRQLATAKAFSHPITTRIDPARGFYAAEGYHQDYLVLHPDQPYIAAYDLPKVQALSRMFPSRYRADPVTVSPV